MVELEISKAALITPSLQGIENQYEVATFIIGRDFGITRGRFKISQVVGAIHELPPLIKNHQAPFGCLVLIIDLLSGGFINFVRV